MQIVQPTWFHNKTSYEAFLYALTLVNKIKQAQSNGAVIYDTDRILQGEWVVEYDPGNPWIGVEHERCYHGYVGSQWDSRSGKVYCTKKEVKDAFKGISWVYPKDFHKLF